ncbi:MAG: hypothetical protein HC942_02275 [Microcoleus sp. SU_5_6]|nr:hypothetical protein [Microcoleus sp. SU_5_6]
MVIGIISHQSSVICQLSTVNSKLPNNSPITQNSPTSSKLKTPKQLSTIYPVIAGL